MYFKIFWQRQAKNLPSRCARRLLVRLLKLSRLHKHMIASFAPLGKWFFVKFPGGRGCRRISLAYQCRWWYTINAKTNKGSMIPHKVGPTGELPLSDGPFVLVCLSRAGQATCRCSVPLHLLPPTQKIQQRCRTMTPPPLCYQSGKEAASSV